MKYAAFMQVLRRGLLPIFLKYFDVNVTILETCPVCRDSYWARLTYPYFSWAIFRSPAGGVEADQYTFNTNKLGPTISPATTIHSLFARLNYWWAIEIHRPPKGVFIKQETILIFSSLITGRPSTRPFPELILKRDHLYIWQDSLESSADQE